MFCWINIFDGVIRAGLYALLAAFAVLACVDANVTVPAKLKFSQHLIWTNIQTIPACFTQMRIDQNILRHFMALERTVKFHFSFS